MQLFATVLVVFILLMISELLWRKKGVHSEITRKFVHISVGSFVAFWPYLLSPNHIKLLSVAFLVVAAMSKYFNIFKAIHSVLRPTWGEVWFAVVVCLLSFLIHHPHIYTAALLVMSLGDGMAAVIGTYYGNRHRYSVLGSSKTILGTLTFFVISFAILLGYSLMSSSLEPSLLVAITLAATVLENFSYKGLDNLVIPLFVAGSLYLVS